MLKSLLGKLTSHTPTKMVIIVRTDLKMGRGKIASQAAHAAILLYQSCVENSHSDLGLWLEMGQPKVILKIDNDCERVMQHIIHKAKQKKLNVCLVRDAGKTQVQLGTLTAIGIGPNQEDEIDKLTGNLKLL